MKKVYVMFGEIPTENETKTTHAFEALLEGNEVRIIMPTALYSTCSNLARAFELQPYLIEGEVFCKDNNGQPVIINPTIIEKLRFDKNKEVYICECLEPQPIYDSSFDNTPLKDYPKWTLWKRINASFHAQFQ